MNYFILKQDSNLENSIVMEDFNGSQNMILFKEDEDTFKDSINIPIIANENSVFPEFYQAPVLMVSNDLYKIFNMYENSIIYKLVFFTDLKNKIQKVYRLVLPSTLDALSKKTTYLKNGWVDKIVLDKNKIGDYKIFRIKAGVEYYFIVSLDVAESILKRKFIGIKFEKVGVS